MKHRLFFVVVTAVCGLVFAINDAFSGVGNIRQTKHNLSSTGAGGTLQTIRASGMVIGDDQVCVFCHTPHNSVADYPLWNHQLQPSGTLYTWYTSATLLSPPPASVDGDSKLCLSCHDGTVSLGAVQNIMGQTVTIPMTAGIGVGALTGRTLFGTNLSGHHPISIEYNGTLKTAKDGQCVSVPITWTLASPANVAAPVELKPTNNCYSPPCSTPPYQGVQCSSCHDPHITNTKFLRTGTTGSWSTNYNDSLCLSCHCNCLPAPCP